MLGQARQFLDEDASLDTSKYLLLRADVGRLPFATGSGGCGGVDGTAKGMGAGIGVHCWFKSTAGETRRSQL
jgi:hypothetical protein